MPASCCGASIRLGCFTKTLCNNFQLSYPWLWANTKLWFQHVKSNNQQSKISLPNGQVHRPFIVILRYNFNKSITTKDTDSGLVHSMMLDDLSRPGIWEWGVLMTANLLDHILSNPFDAFRFRISIVVSSFLRSVSTDAYLCTAITPTQIIGLSLGSTMSFVPSQSSPSMIPN